MRKISVCAAGVAVLILIGVGTWIGLRTKTWTPALATTSTVDPFAMMTSAKDLPTCYQPGGGSC